MRLGLDGRSACVRHRVSAGMSLGDTVKLGDSAFLRNNPICSMSGRETSTRKVDILMHPLGTVHTSTGQRINPSALSAVGRTRYECIKNIKETNEQLVSVYIIFRIEFTLYSFSSLFSQIRAPDLFLSNNFLDKPVMYLYFPCVNRALLEDSCLHFEQSRDQHGILANEAYADSSTTRANRYYMLQNLEQINTLEYSV